MDEILGLYKEHLATLRSDGHVPKVNDKVYPLWLEEVERIDLHIRRLESNHAICTKPCCPACTMGGK